MLSRAQVAASSPGTQRRKRIGSPVTGSTCVNHSKKKVCCMHCERQQATAPRLDVDAEGDALVPTLAEKDESSALRDENTDEAGEED